MASNSQAGTFLILGAGQIGKAAAIKLFAHKEVKRVIIHTLTEQEAKEATIYLEHHRPRHVELKSSWGDVLGPILPKGIDPEAAQTAAFNYYYRPFNGEVIRSSGLYQTIKKWRPEYVVDGINTATVFGYHGKLYELERKLWQQMNDSIDSKVRDHLTKATLMAAFVPKIIRFVQTLERAILDYGVKRYVKISTTGLGGMGFNIPYTHGEPAESGVSSRLLGKAAAAGVINHLLWNLSHTPNINVGLIIPATLVGWDSAKSQKIQINEGDTVTALKLVSESTIQKLQFESKLRPGSKQSAKALKVPSIGSGENGPFGLAEMAAISAPYQMGSITKEEVADAAVETVFGSEKFNVLAAMNNSILGPSIMGAEQRLQILHLLETLEENGRTLSLVTGNPGTKIAKHLFELYLILKVNPSINLQPEKVGRNIQELIKDNGKIRNTILSLGFPIFTDQKSAYIGTFWKVPGGHDDDTITKENVEKWADLGWVDIRPAHIGWWVKTIKALPKERYGSAMAHKNLSRRTGELLAAVYDNLGLGRK